MIRPKYAAISLMNIVLLVLPMKGWAVSVFQIKGTVIAVQGFEATIQVERTIDQAPAVGNKVDLLETNAAGSVVLVRKDWEITEVLSGLVKARPVNATAHDLPKVNMKAVIHLSKQTVQDSPKGKELLTYHDAFSGPKDTKKKFSKAEGKVIMIRGDVIHIRVNDRTQSATEGDYVKLSYTVDGEVIPVGTWRVSTVKDGGLLEALPIEMKGKPNVGMDALVYLQEKPKGGIGKERPPESVSLEGSGEAVRLENTCAQGKAAACTQLGNLYEKGQGVVVDYPRAAAYYRKACEGGHAEGCNHLGALYGIGRGLPKDDKQATALYRKACEGGSAFGCSNLGFRYQNGLGVEQDYRLAVAFLQKGCDGGNADACTSLGYQYGTGLGVTLDFRRAVALYRQACDGGSLHGCKNLGILYRDGLGVARDPRLAVELFKKACDGGIADGCGNLGWMYYTGNEIAADKARGLALMDQACRMGDSWSCNKLKELGQKK
jgi:TPR repeat protein